VGISFTRYAKKKIKKVHALSAGYNGKSRDHTEVLLELVKKHEKEIRDLYAAKDQHFTVEVGDLLILCMEILLEHRKDMDGILDKCYRRYEKKLSLLLAPRGERGKDKGGDMPREKITNRKKNIPRVIRDRQKRLGGKLVIDRGKKRG